MAYGACANDMRSSRDALAKSRFPGVGKGLTLLLFPRSIIRGGGAALARADFGGTLAGRTVRPRPPVTREEL